MKKLVKVIIVGAVILMTVSAPVFSQGVPKTMIEKMQDSMGNFSKNVALKIPFNSTIGSNWSEAYIGKFPKFGAGLSVGFTTLGFDELKGLLDAVDVGNAVPDFLSNIGMPLMGYTADVRLGGFVLPFDMGFKIGYLPLEFAGFGLDYLLFGFDVRYAVVDIPIVKVAVGAAFNHLKGGITVPLGQGTNMDFPVGLDTYKLNLSRPSMGIEWGTNSFELKAQASFNLAIITPYAGLGLGHATSTAGYRIKTSVTIKDEDGNSVGTKEKIVTDALKKLGVTGVSDNGFESIEKVGQFTMRLYGGLSFNMAFIKIDATFLYNLVGDNLGFTLGFRFQL